MRVLREERWPLQKEFQCLNVASITLYRAHVNIHNCYQGLGLGLGLL